MKHMHGGWLSFPGWAWERACSQSLALQPAHARPTGRTKEKRSATQESLTVMNSWRERRDSNSRPPA